MNYTIAVAQTDAAIGSIQKNLSTHIAFIEKAIKKKAQVIVFPELSLTGYSIKDMNWDVALRVEPQKIFSNLLKLSKHITIVLGAVEEAENYGIYNSTFLFEDGKVHIAHRKIYLPTYGMFEEMRYFSPGNDIRCFQSKFGRLGILICEDFWHITLPYIAAQDGADVIIGMAASPTRISGTNDELNIAIANHEQHRAYARLLSTYVVWSNRVGFEDGINFWGGSHIVSPSGTTISKGKYFDEDLIFAEVSEDEIRRARRFSRHSIDESAAFTIEQLKKSLKRREK